MVVRPSSSSYDVFSKRKLIYSGWLKLWLNKGCRVRIKGNFPLFERLPYFKNFEKVSAEKSIDFKMPHFSLAQVLQANNQMPIIKQLFF